MIRIATPSSTTLGIGYMVIAMIFFSVMNNCIRQATTLMSPADLVMWRNVMTVILMGAWILVFHSPQQFKTQHWKRHAFRAVLGIIAIELWFYSLSAMPINEATALSFTAPIFTSLFAIIWLKERSNMARWFAIIVGLMGTVVILNPSSEALQFTSLAVLISAALMGGSGIIIKTLTRTDHTDTIVFYQGAMMLPLSLPFVAYYGFNVPSLEGLFWALSVTLCSVAAHLCMTRAFAATEMVILAPFDFTRLIFTALIAYFWFGETLAGDTVLGGFLIVAGSAIATAVSNERVKEYLKRVLVLTRE